MLPYILLGLGIALLLLEALYPWLPGVGMIGTGLLVAAAATFWPDWQAAAVIALIGVFAIAATARGVWRVRQLHERSNQRLIGRQAVVRTVLSPDGYVVSGGERWPARMDHGSAKPGEKVRIIATNGPVLVVTLAPAEVEAPSQQAP